MWTGRRHPAAREKVADLQEPADADRDIAMSLTLACSIPRGW